MATQVLIAHTGQRLQIDTSHFSLVDELKSSIARQTSIPSPHLILLTPQGKSVKIHTLHQEGELYVYDRRLSQPTSTNQTTASLVSEAPAPKRYTVPKAPDYIESADDVSAWQDLCHERRTWASGLAEDCESLSRRAEGRYDEVDVMLKCLDAAVANMEHSVKQIEPRWQELKKWIEPALPEHKTLAANCENYLSLSRHVPISPDMVRYMTSREITKKQATLEDLIELDTAKKAVSLVSTCERKFRGKAEELDRTTEAMYGGLRQLFDDFDALVGGSTLSHSQEPAQLLEDIQALTKKIDTDAQIVQEYGNTQRDVSQASRTAQNHTQHLIPSLKKRAKEMDDMLLYATTARNAVAASVVDMMRSIADVTSLHTSAKIQINALNQAEDELTTFDYLRLIRDLPYMYASFVAEAIRRREWSDKIKNDSSTLANEMALFQEEESKRRRKWQKMIGSAYGADKIGANIASLEVNLLAEEETWPHMSKNDLEDFLAVLQRQETEAEAVEEVSKLVNEINNPTKQQSKRLKAFKNGSMHEAALGRSGLMIRGDDDLLRSLQDDKGKLENKLKTAESRVRRLEDLLHRTQASRPNLGSLFGHERHGSRQSINSPPPAHDEPQQSSAETEALRQRVQQLEAELNSERSRASTFEKDLNNRNTEHHDMKGQMDEINSTKKDLLGNMEALKREFVEERKSLEEEIKQLKGRIEETEDDIEHFGESRDHEKATYEEKIRSLEQELAKVQNETRDETQKAHGQVEFLRKEARLQREHNEDIESQLHGLQEENKALGAKFEAEQSTAASRLRALRELHQLFLPETAAPNDEVDLVDMITSRSADAVAKLKTTENDLSVLRSDLDDTQGYVKTLKAELTESRDRVTAEEEATMHLRESLSEERAKVSALEKEAADGRKQLHELRSQLADGETGSESLQRKLDEEEERLTSLAEQLATKQSQMGSLEEELRMCKEKLHESQGHVKDLTTRFDARTERTKDMTQRLYSQNDRLSRLLERLGFSVTRDGSNMSIQKIPRSERGAMSQTQAAHDSSDPGQASVRRSTTFPTRQMADSADLELLHWTNCTETTMEAEKYSAFIDKLGGFDMDLAGDTIYRRVKDIEHLAKKLQRDSRSYREKARASQKDAHEKIAYKHFKEGDLALFLPTKNQTSGAWAAFNVGFPHYFLREQDGHRLRNREWIVARITRIEERVVDLSKSLHNQLPDSDSVNETDDNPFQLSDGLRWYMIDAYEDKPGAPSTPGLGKSTTAATNVEARADMHSHAQAAGQDRAKATDKSIQGVSKVLSKSLESRRSSSNSKKALPFVGGGGASLLKGNALASETNSLRAAAPETPEATSPPAAGEASASRNPQQIETARQSAGEQAEGVEDPTAPDNEAASRQEQQHQQKDQSRLQPLQRQESSGLSVESPSKKSVVWDSLWNVDVAYEGGSSGK